VELGNALYQHGVSDGGAIAAGPSQQGTAPPGVPVRPRRSSPCRTCMEQDMTSLSARLGVAPTDATVRPATEPTPPAEAFQTPPPVDSIISREPGNVSVNVPEPARAGEPEALRKLKESAREQLFERMGARLSDP